MVGKLTALFLAILVANPFCCCFAADAEAPVAELACCQIAAPEAAPANPADTEPCDCTEDQADPAALGGEVKPMIPEWSLLSERSFKELAVRGWPHVPQLRAVPEAADAVKPPGRVLSQVHCRYLL